MIWNLVFMIFGALIFGAGIFFERERAYTPEEEETEAEEENIPEGMLRQWENLLGYDGNEQEEYDENI